MPPEENGWFSNDFLESNYYYYYDLKNINRPPSASFAEKKKIKILNVKIHLALGCGPFNRVTRRRRRRLTN
jgi:hypothetical protein